MFVSSTEWYSPTSTLNVAKILVKYWRLNTLNVRRRRVPHITVAFLSSGRRSKSMGALKIFMHKYNFFFTYSSKFKHSTPDPSISTCRDRECRKISMKKSRYASRNVRHMNSYFQGLIQVRGILIHQRIKAACSLWAVMEVSFFFHLTTNWIWFAPTFWQTLVSVYIRFTAYTLLCMATSKDIGFILLEVMYWVLLVNNAIFSSSD